MLYALLCIKIIRTDISLRITLTYSQELLFMIKEHLHNDFDDARIRNLALSELLIDIQSNKLRTPFNEIPSYRVYDKLIGW